MLRVDADSELVFAQKERCLLTEEFLQIASHAKNSIIHFPKLWRFIVQINILNVVSTGRWCIKPHLHRPTQWYFSWAGKDFIDCVRNHMSSITFVHSSAYSAYSELEYLWALFSARIKSSDLEDVPKVWAKISTDYQSKQVWSLNIQNQV